jgi:hypothetical protein
MRIVDYPHHHRMGHNHSYDSDNGNRSDGFTQEKEYLTEIISYIGTDIQLVVSPLFFIKRLKGNPGLQQDDTLLN